MFLTSNNIENNCKYYSAKSCDFLVIFVFFNLFKIKIKLQKCSENISNRAQKNKKNCKIYIMKNIQKIHTQYQDEARVISNTNIRK